MKFLNILWNTTETNVGTFDPKNDIESYDEYIVNESTNISVGALFGKQRVLLYMYQITYAMII